jgi:cell pole-organizing protein PopZ
MADAKPQAEPSMEEILASIRRIISEDAPAEAEPQTGKTVSAPPAAAAAPAPAKPAPRPAPVAETRIEEQEEEDEVLDLTEKVSDDGTVVNLRSAKPAPAAPPVPEEIELQDATEIAATPEPQPAPQPAPRAPAPASDLVSAAAAEAATASFAALARAVDNQPTGSPISVGGRTLEDIVKEMVRPMIRDWLDVNLPSLVERLVRREIERIAHRGQD